MDAYLGEIRLFSGNFVPVNWALCDGRLLPIRQNTALFSLLGTQFGGDGTTTFGLPDFRARGPMDFGQGPGLSQRNMGQTLGAATATLNTTQLPAHGHPPAALAASGNSTTPMGNVSAEITVGRTAQSFYSTTPGANLVAMAASALQAAGGGQAHNNLAPFLGLNFIICLSGAFPPRS